MLLTQSNIEYKITEAAIDLEINVGMYIVYRTILFFSVARSYNYEDLTIYLFLYNFNNGVI